MSVVELHNLGIAEASRLIQSKKLSPVELTEGLLARSVASAVSEST